MDNNTQYRIWRSPYSRFGGLNSLRPNELSDETITAERHYTDEILSGIAKNGFNAIWIHGVLANVTKAPDFPEYGKNAEMHIKSINTLVERAARHGIKIFMYCQPVRSIAAGNHEFWNNHPECAGQHEMSVEQVLPENLDNELEMICLCTSEPKVKKLIVDCSSYLAKMAPNLGGVILITASEYPGHCYSHRRKVNPSEWAPLVECPRCKEREPWEVAAEQVCLMHEGIRKESDSMEIIAWNWGWAGYTPAPCRPILEMLPKDVIIMTDFERGGTMDLNERPGHRIDEYSMTFHGPSPLCKGCLEVAKELGMRRMAKLQLGTTHELGNVVALPLMDSILDKADWLRQNPDVGYMGCWNIGNMLSANTFGFNYFIRQDAPEDKATRLAEFAQQYFPGCDAKLLMRAWNVFDQAMKDMPFVIPFLYRGVHTHALAYTEIYRSEPLKGTPYGCSYMPSPWGDDLSVSIPPGYSLDEIVNNLTKMAALWTVGAQMFQDALANCADDKCEIGNAIICSCIWESSSHAYRAYRLRLNWDDAKRPDMRHIIIGEIDTLKRALPWVEKDTRQGYHPEAACYMFDGQSIRQKLAFLEEELKKLNFTDSGAKK